MLKRGNTMRWQKTISLTLVLFLALVLLPTVMADNVDVYLFYGRGCPHCSKEETFLEDMEEKYDITVHEKEVYFNEENRQLFQDMSDAFGREISGVPTTFIDNKVFVGFSESLGKTIEDEIKRCSEEGCVSPEERMKKKQAEEEPEVVKEEGVTSVVTESSPAENPETTSMRRKLTIPAVLGAAAVDAVNPCAFAVLIILMTTILACCRRKALFAGLAFTLSIYISYMLMGLGLFSALQVAGLTHWFYGIVAGFAILIGLFNLKDYFWHGKWFVMEVPRKWRPAMKRLIKGVTSVPGAFLIGFVVSLFLLPCTSGPYIVILGLLAKVTTFWRGFGYLVLYNFIFIIPMLVITFSVAFGITTTEKAEEWRQRKLKILHLIAGIILILLGIGMYIAMYLGYV